MKKTIRLLLIICSLIYGCKSNNDSSSKKLPPMDIDKVLEQYKRATNDLLNGNAEPYKQMFSHREDVTLSNPLYPTVRGWQKVSETLQETASRLKEGEFVSSEIFSKYVTHDLAYVVSIAHEKVKMGESTEVTSISLRNTMILRPEEGTWKIVHLHGDFLTPPHK
jgi:ketosteroid isomerase-like protein